MNTLNVLKQISGSESPPVLSNIGDSRTVNIVLGIKVSTKKNAYEKKGKGTMPQ